MMCESLNLAYIQHGFVVPSWLVLLRSSTLMLGGRWTINHLIMVLFLYLMNSTTQLEEADFV